MIETAAAFVDPAGRGWSGQLGLHDDAVVPGYRSLADDLRAAGSLSIAQLFHGGVRAPSAVTGQQPVSASVFHEDGPRFETPRALEAPEIVEVVRRFADAARRAEQAGLDGVELHGAHGYLPSQFLSATMNTRNDAWGGSLEGRARLLREALRTVRAAVSSRFLVGVRLSLEDFGFARGLDLDESLQVAAWLAEDGADFLHASLWNGRAPTHKRPDAHPLPLLRDAVGSALPLVAAGAVTTPDDAAHLLDLGADLVAVGRAAIANPDWASRAGHPGWTPTAFPLSPEALAAVDVAPPFVTYLRERFKGLVADP